MVSSSIFDDQCSAISNSVGWYTCFTNPILLATTSLYANLDRATTLYSSCQLLTRSKELNFDLQKNKKEERKMRKEKKKHITLKQLVILFRNQSVDA